VHQVGNYCIANMKLKIYRKIRKWIQLDREELHGFYTTNNYINLAGIVWAE